MGILKGDPKTDDFFELNPEARYFEHIPRLIENEGEEKAGKILWAIYMSEDPSSMFFHHREERRRKMIKDNFLRDYPDFEWEDYDTLIAAYPRLFLPKIQREFRTYMMILERARAWLETQSMDENAKGILDRLSQLTKVWKEYEDLEEKFKNSLLQEEEAMRGERQVGGAAKRRQRIKKSA